MLGCDGPLSAQTLKRTTSFFLGGDPNISSSRFLFIHWEQNNNPGLGDMMESVEKECGALGGLFQAIVNDMKYSYPVWEDFITKATKLHSQLRTTVLATAAFLDAFQKVADMATNTRGATRDIGSALTRMCMRHRSIEAKLRHFTNALMEKMIGPLQDKIEEWKKTAALLDKDHAKEYKRSRQEIKKKSSDTIKLQKKARKGRGGLQPQLNSAMQDVNDMYLLMEETEKQAVRRALLEERGRYCTFISFLQPVVVGEIAMLGEATHLQAIIEDLTVLTTDPHKLPEASEQVILDLKGSDYNWSYQTPPSSPSSIGSRKSSLCSLVHLPPGGAHRLSSVSSHDSGFVSQDANVHSKPPSPMPSDITSQKSSSSASSEASETCQSVSECGSPTILGSSFATFRPSHCFNESIRPHSYTLPASPSYNQSPGSNSPSPTAKVPYWKQDWSKVGQYEQLSVGQQRRTEAAEPSSGAGGHTHTHPEDTYRLARMNSKDATAKHGKLVSSAASELAMVLTRGLSIEQTQKSSCDSLQYSSGYSTQNTTPSCSEDTIPSQGSEYDCYSMNGDADNDTQTDFDKSSTVPRHSNLAQNYRRMIQTKRPASTAGLHGALAGPTTNGKGSSIIASGTATIRRTPSSKTNVRRTPSTVGPIPIRPPIVPVKTPTVPDSPGFLSPPPEHNGSEESLYNDDSMEILEYKASPKRMSLPTWGSGGGSVYSQPPGAAGFSSEEDQILAANRHSLVEKIGELVANAHALGEGQFPFPADPLADQSLQQDEGHEKGGEDMLKTIRRGVRLRKVSSNDRSAPRIMR
ncbi:MTSS I-BAR domain containing 2a isoform X1 [Danio rerio]|uniref:MTSS I-BAR domain containing 2a isoform X1 n=1 Tax=Danio rerio TaxID=7955 RepID=A0A8M3AJH9_DANRE|nr:MTSS1-like protein isoform X2 [Danio rerio]|eukprot:XP_009291775.1 MTSS1-like protein isoform X2 [Danio rerio]